MYNTIAIDFDGTIAEYDGWKGVGVFGKPIKGAVGSINSLKKEGWKIIIWTTRGETELIREYLSKHEIPFDSINENLLGTPKNVSDKKVTADIYIDDRAIRFNSWKDTLERVGQIKLCSAERPSRVNTELMCSDLQLLVEQANKSEHFAEYLEELIASAKVKIDAEKRYGTVGWNALGVKGIFVDVHRKFIRLKNFFWEDKNFMTTENILDTCRDLVNYSIHMAMAYKQKGEK